MPTINTSSRQHIQIGSQSNDGTGDSIRTAFLKVNQNFTELYYAGGGEFRFGDLKDFNIAGYPVETGGMPLGPGNQFITTVNNGSGTYLVTSTLVSGTGISIIPTITSTGSFYTINNAASSLVTDPNPTLGANLVGSTGTSSFRAIQFANPTADQDLVTRKFLYDNFLNRDGQYIVDNNNTATTTATVIVEGSTLRHNVRLLTTATSSTHIVNKEYADSKISLDGIARNAIYGTMTGPLLLSRDPIEGDPTLQAATKGYVDNNAYFSENNLHISTKGSDYQPNTPASKRGRNWQYAFNTINHAAEYAEQLIAVSKIEVGDYSRLITYGTAGTTPCTVISVSDNYYGNNLARLALFAGDQGSNQFGSAPKGKFTIFPGQYIQGVESEAIALIEGIATEGGQEIYTIAYVDYGVSFNTPVTTSIADVTKPHQVTFTFSDTKMVPIPNFWVGYKFYIDPYDPAQPNKVGTIVAVNSVADTTGVYYDSVIVEYPNNVPFAVGPSIPADQWHVYSGDFIANESVIYNTNVSALQITFVVESGEYYEQLPIKLSNNTSIRGDEFRRVIIRPAKGISNSIWANTYFRRDAQIDRLQTTALSTVTDYATFLVSANVTPSAVSGFITVSLSNGTLPTTYVGYMFTGNSGQGIITAVLPGGFAVDIGTALTDIGVIASGQWHIYKPITFGYHYLRNPNMTMKTFITQDNKGGLINAAAVLTTGTAFIQQSVVDFINTTYGSTTFSESLCRRDVGTIVKSLVHDMIDGGAGQVITSADFIAKVPSLTTGQCASAVNHIKVAVSQLFASNVVESSASVILNDMIDAAVKIINNDPTFNPPKLNGEMDVFLCNDANVIRYVSCQNHGGFMMVLDPVGQIKNKSPYTQTASSFSQSIAKHRFAGGMFIDGFAGNVIATPTASSYIADPLHVTVSGLRRKQQVPTFFTVRGIRYEVDFISNFTPAGVITYPDGSTVTDYSAILNLNPLSPGGIPNPVSVTDTIGGFRTAQSAIPIIIDQPSGIGGLAATGHATSDVSGKITSIVIDFPGTGYLVAPNISIGGAIFNNLTFTTGNGIASASIVNGGSGYAVGCRIEFLPINAFGAVAAYGVVTSVDVDGGITSFIINTPGSNWSVATQYQVVFGNMLITVPTPVSGFIDTVPAQFELITAGNRSMLANDFTQVNDLGYGIFATNGGFAENVSMFTYYNYRSYYSLNGAQMRTTTGSSCYGEYGLCAEGSDPNEVPLAVNITYPLTQIAKAYVYPPLFPATLGQASVYITIDPTNGGYPPMNGSQVEINHSGIIRTYSVGAATPATDVSNKIIPNVYQLFFNSGNISSGATTGLYASLRNNDTVIVRANTLVKLRGVNPSVISRPSTSLTYNDDPTYVYHITGFSTVQPDSSVFVYTLEDYNYITFQSTEQGVTYPTLTNTGSGYSSTVTVSIQLALAAPTSHTVSGDQGANTGGIQAVYLNTVAGIMIGQEVSGNSIITGTMVTYINSAINLVGISYPTSNISTGDGTITNGTSLTFTSVNPTAHASITSNGNIGAITIDSGGAGWISSTTAISITGNASINSPVKIAGIAGTSIIKINPLELLSANRIWSGLVSTPVRNYQFALGNQIYNIVGYRGQVETGQSWAEIDIDRPLVEDIGKGVILRAGFPINSAGAVTTRISLLRATGHDFVDIGTGGYADTRIPNDLYGPPINIPQQSHEVIETNKARVYYMTTDQDGNFRVGNALTVNQAKGSVSISVPLDISNLSSISLRRDLGPPVNEFSVDNTMVTEADYKVPTEQAVANYINRRLGLDRNGAIYAGAPLGPQFLDLRGLLEMKGTLNMGAGGNNISNLNTPRPTTYGYGRDAANKNYADLKLSLDGTFATDTDGTSHLTAQGEMSGPLQLYQDPENIVVTLKVNATSPTNYLILNNVNQLSTQGHIYGTNIPDGTIITGIDYPNSAIFISKYITGNLTFNTQFTVDPIIQAVTKRYVDKNKQFNQLSDVTLTNATNQDLVMFGPALVVNTSTNPPVYNAGTRLVNVANDVSTIVNTPTSRAGGSDLTITRTNNIATFKLVGGAGSSNPITDYHINNDAQIAQSKLFMNAAVTSASAPTGGQRAQQLSLGVAEFDSIMFTANNGWISLANATTIANGIIPSKHAYIPVGGGLLGATNTAADTAASYVSSATVQTWLQNISSAWSFSSNLNPNTDLAESLGTGVKRWGTVYANTAILNSGISLNTNATITTDVATANVFNTVATTVNAFGAATAVNIGAATGLTSVKNNLNVAGNTGITGTLGVTSDLSVNTNKFNVAAATGNTLVAGTLGVTGVATLSSTANITGDLNVNTNKFNVTAANGNTLVAGTLGVTGVTSLTSDLNIATNKFNVASATGNTLVAGTLGVTGVATLSSTANITGDLNIATNKFNVTAANGNTLVAGTLGVTGVATLSSTANITGDLNVNTNKFTVASASGNVNSLGTISGTSFNGSGSGLTSLSVPNSALQGSGTITFTGTSGTGNVALGGTLTFTSGNGVTLSYAAGTITVNTSQDLRTTASPSFTKLSITGGGVGAAAASALNITGDLTLARSATTGVLYLGSNGSQYVYYDGTNYNMPNGQLYVNGTQVVLNSGSWSISVTNAAHLFANVQDGLTNLTLGGFSGATGANATWYGGPSWTASTNYLASNISGVADFATNLYINELGIRTQAYTASVASTVVARDASQDIRCNVLHGTATAAQYADLAENYLADAVYEVGTVLEFGGELEITIAEDGTRRVAGVVSTNPAHLMNSALTGEFVTALALTGRVPVKVRGKVRKGDMMISAGGGFARASYSPVLGSVIGKALQNFDGVEGVIEVVVGRM